MRIFAPRTQSLAATDICGQAIHAKRVTIMPKDVQVQAVVVVCVCVFFDRFVASWHVVSVASAPKLSNRPATI